MQATTIYLWNKGSILELESSFWWDNQMFDFIKNEDESYEYKKVSGSVVIFLILYVDDILIIENDFQLQSVKL